jgi:hypothetical protein
MTDNVMQNAPRKFAFNPAVKTLQFRAWAWCQTHGTDLTAAELAAELDVPAERLRRVLRDETWARALRTSNLDMTHRPRHEAGFVREAVEIGRRLDPAISDDE